MNKKIASTLMTACSLVTLLVTGACDNLQGFSGSDPIKGIQEVNISSARLGLNVDTTVNCSFESYFNSGFDFEVENADLKKWCFTSLMDAHDIGIADLKIAPNPSTSPARTQATFFLSRLGFEDIQKVTIGAGETEDTNDTVKMVFSKKSVKHKMKTKCFVNISLCGSDGGEEWKSDFDVGANIPEYTGTHTDWTNKDNHKGFDVAATRVYEFLKEEFKSIYISETETIIAISGYSRGAAVSNLLAAKLIDNPTGIRKHGFKLASYNFACSTTTCASTCKDSKYNVIHNFLNTEDTITRIPPTSDTMNFQRYGIDHDFKVSTDASVKARVEALTGRAYDAEPADEVKNALAAMVTTREGLYRPIQDEAHKTYSVDNIANETEELARADYDAFYEEMCNKGLGHCFSYAGVTQKMTTKTIDDPNEGMMDVDMPYYVWHAYCGEGLILQALLTAMSNVLSNTPEYALKDAYLTGYCKQGANFQIIADGLRNHPTYFVDAHYPATYFCGCFTA